jgi:hypothetical protein
MDAASEARDRHAPTKSVGVFDEGVILLDRTLQRGA